MEKFEAANWLDFVYFSFVTITTLGYGDIYPLRVLSQTFVIVEVMIGMGLVVIYLGTVIEVIGARGIRNMQEKVKSP